MTNKNLEQKSGRMPINGTIQFKIKNNFPDENIGVKLNASGEMELIKPEGSNAEIHDVIITNVSPNNNKAYSERLPEGGCNFWESGFLSKYDRVYVIDTSCDPKQKVDEEILAVSCFLAFKLTISGDEIVPSIIFKNPQLFEFRNPKNPAQNVEKIGWYMLIDKICKEGVSYSEKIAIITDKDYGNLKKYNDRELPIIDDFFLPKQFSIHYAREKNSLGLLNQIIKTCDHESKSLRDHIIANNSIFKEKPESLYDNLFDRFKFWIAAHKTFSIVGAEKIPTAMSGTFKLYGIKE